MPGRYISPGGLPAATGSHTTAAQHASEHRECAHQQQGQHERQPCRDKAISNRKEASAQLAARPEADRSRLPKPQGQILNHQNLTDLRPRRPQGAQQDTLSYALGAAGEDSARQHHYSCGYAEECHKTDSEGDFLHNGINGLEDQRQVDGRDIGELLDYRPLYCR